MKLQGPTPSKRKYSSDSKKTPGKVETKKKDALSNEGLADDQDDNDKITTTLDIYLHQYICCSLCKYTNNFYQTVEVNCSMIGLLTLGF